MKRFLIPCFLFILLLPGSSNGLLAHPGIGIVRDSKGNIYYTDLKHIWKIDKTGNKTIAVKNVHSHELYVDANDNLYGEHLWYNGEKLNSWGHYVWCLKNDGDLVKEIEPAEGFLNDYSFVRDSAGNMYWVERFTISRFMKKTPDGKIIKLAEGRFGFIGWLYSTANGTIYFIEKNKLQKLSGDGKITLVTGMIGSRTTGFNMFGRNYDGYGIWTDASDNIYIAMIAAKKIYRISPAGKTETIANSNSLWTATSGVFDDDGNLWLLETSIANETRVRKINKKELTGINSSSPVNPTHLLMTIITISVLAITWFSLKFFMRKEGIKPGKRLISITH